MALLARRLAVQEHDQRQDDQYADADQDQSLHREVVGQNRACLADVAQVLNIERGHAVGQNDAVHNSQCNPNQREHARSKDSLRK